MSAEKMAKYLIQFKWVDTLKPDSSRWANWKEIEKENDEEAFAEAEKEFNEKRNWAIPLSLLSFRVCRILEKKDCVKK